MVYKLANQTTLSMDEINAKVTAIKTKQLHYWSNSISNKYFKPKQAVEGNLLEKLEKSFAVVAGEVRNLTNKKCGSDKWYKNLVELANSKAYEGKSISNKIQRWI